MSQQTAGPDTTGIQRVHADELLADRVRLLFKEAVLTLSNTAAAAVIFVLLLVANHSGGQALHLQWLVVMLLIVGLRALLAWRYRETFDGSGVRLWLLRYRAGALATAACWGAAGVLFFNPDSEALQAFTLLVIAGNAAGSMGVLAADYPTYRGYVILTLAPPMLVSFVQLSYFQAAVGALLLLLAEFLLRAGRHSARSMSDSMFLRYEIANLVGELEQEKARVLNQAETMLGKVLSSAPIKLWVTDLHGEVTYMNSQPQGHQGRIPVPIVGDNLLRFFARRPKLVRDARRVLKGGSFVTELAVGEITYELHYSPYRDEQGVQQGAIGVAIDISERKRHEQELLRRANYDELTGLANRALIMELVTRAFARARRTERIVAVYFLDLDNFKSINDTQGHAAGNDLLCRAAERLQRGLRANDVAARISGDEFLVVAEDLDGVSDAETLAAKMVGTFHQPFMLDGCSVFTTVSVGIALFPRDSEDPDQLVQCADTAMYSAKEAGKNSYRFFNSAMHQKALRQLTIGAEVRQALQRNELSLYYQPQVDLRSGMICAAEALLRWDSAELGPVSPEEFIPAAEMAGLMSQLGEWVLRSACHEAATWQRLAGRPVRVAVNISPQQFRGADLLANVASVLADSGLPVSALELEITEGVLVHDVASVRADLQELRDLGLSLALDDFGTGYSSLNYLRRFPLQVLKIDKSFVLDLDKSEDGRALVYTIITMARSLRMGIVAEGVETLDQYDYLRAQGVKLMQGYLFSRPVPVSEFRAMLVAQARGDGELPWKQDGNPLARFG